MCTRSIAYAIIMARLYIDWYEQMKLPKYIYKPWVRAVLDRLLAVFAPPVAILKVIHLALGQERHSGLPLPLLGFLLVGFGPVVTYIYMVSF